VPGTVPCGPSDSTPRMYRSHSIEKVDVPRREIRSREVAAKARRVGRSLSPGIGDV
jgi:hypothetical protein